MASTQKVVVLVDDEEDVVFSLNARLARVRPDLQTHAFGSSVQAQEWISHHMPNLVVSDLRMPHISGSDLALHTRRLWPGVPFLVMTAFPTERTRVEDLHLTSIHYIQKPFDFNEFIRLVDDLLARQDAPGFLGAVSAATLLDLVQLFHLTTTNGALRIWHGTQSGSVWFERGAVVHAVADTLEGLPAFFELVRWSAGQFSMEPDTAAPTYTITENTTALVLEAARLRDESSQPRFAGEWSGLIQEDELEFIDPEEDPGNPFHANFSHPQPIVSPGGGNMSQNLSISLEKLRSLDGYVGACIVDSESAMSLASDGGGQQLNLEVAAAGNAEVVKAKRKTMRALGLKDEIEDILISLNRQYHLIRPMRTRPNVFIYCALDRTRANLAMARMILSDVERTLEF